MSAPLSHLQKRLLSQLSDRAFACVSAESDGQYFYDDLPATKAREQFRHDQVVKACGKIGLRCCSQEDYKLVEAHFLNLCGETGKALNAHVRAVTEPRRQAEAVLNRELVAGGFNLSYAAAICQRQFRCTLADATEKQLWNLVYTVRNRAAARRREKHQTN